MVSILQSGKVANWQSVMNVPDRSLMAAFTNPVSTRQCLASRRAPADAIRTRRASLPTRVCGSIYELGLPLRHANTRTKDADRMKITDCPTELLTAPIASAGSAVRMMGIRATALRLLRTSPRTKLLAFPIALEGCSAYRTGYVNRCSSHTMIIQHGIEIEERYCEIAAKRMSQTVMALHEASALPVPLVAAAPVEEARPDA